jgi:NADPH-dependent curcumin reductase CurA
MTLIHHQVIMAKRPVGVPKVTDFQLIETPMPTPNEEEALVRSIYLSVDPYMRLSMSEGRSYSNALQIGQVVIGEAVGMLGWQEFSAVRKELISTSTT